MRSDRLRLVTLVIAKASGQRDSGVKKNAKKNSTKRIEYLCFSLGSRPLRTILFHVSHACTMFVCLFFPNLLRLCAPICHSLTHCTTCESVILQSCSLSLYPSLSLLSLLPPNPNPHLVHSMRDFAYLSLLQKQCANRTAFRVTSPPLYIVHNSLW